ETEIDALIDAFGIEEASSLPRNTMGPLADLLRKNENIKTRTAFIVAVMYVLERSKELLPDGRLAVRAIDFDDMIWLPVVLRLSVWTYDRVFVDETQDLNAAQLELALRACRAKGRILAIGDDKQAIYRFRGADSNAVERIIRRLSAKVLPLSVTYRCAQRIVE